MKSPKVYIIKSNNSKTCYIGSCKGYLSKRVQQHRYYYLKWMEGNEHKHNYASFFVFIDDENPTSEILEVCTQETMKIRESELIKEYKEKGWEVVNIIDAVLDVERRNERCRNYLFMS